MDIVLKNDEQYHLTYQYLNCQTKENIQKLVQNEHEIFGNDDGKYAKIFKEFGFDSWSDVEIGFDQILCMNDHYNGAITFDLFLDAKSQKLLKKLIERTEYIQENEFKVEPYLKRNIHQQSFHFTIGTIYIDENDYNEFDSKLRVNG
eukprot:213359_1